MKRIISAFLCLVLFVSAAITVTATGDNGVYCYEIDGVEYTVEFADEDIAPETMEIIAETLVGLRDGSAQTYGLGCTLFGHDWVTKLVYVTQHKVRASVPRCKQDIYEVTYCEDCDKTKEQVLVDSVYINCCPRD
ncbi:MAG: hypothetical protein IJC49_00285 [Clostridia bacterium]|nr:hypothetical protein [Clostridia bacterium]